MKNLWIVSKNEHDERSYDILVGGDWSDEWYQLMNVDKDEDTSHIVVYVNDNRITDIQMSDGYGLVDSIQLTQTEKEQIVKFVNSNK